MRKYRNTYDEDNFCFRANSSLVHYSTPRKHLIVCNLIQYMTKSSLDLYRQSFLLIKISNNSRWDYFPNVDAPLSYKVSLLFQIKNLLTAHIHFNYSRIQLFLLAVSAHCPVGLIKLLYVITPKSLFTIVHIKVCLHNSNA